MNSAPTALHRRGILLALAGGLLLGCQTTPPPADAKAARAAALQNAGFKPQGDEWELSLGTKLLFDPDEDALSAEGKAALASVAQSLRRVGVGRVRVDGHTDSTGSPRHNAALSLRRAEAAAQELIRGGMPALSIERRGFGAERPVADNTTSEGRAQNRRVVITVLID